MKRIEGHPDLARTSSGAIVNTNREAIRKARERKRLQEQKDAELEDLKVRLARLEELIQTRK